MNNDQQQGHVDHELLGEILSGEYKSTIVDELREGPGTPTELAQDSGIHTSHVSRTLGELRDLGLVKLLVDEDRKRGRIHGLSETGKQLSPMVADRGERRA